MINPWKVLGVHRKSTDTEIREQYLVAARLYHPDAAGGAVDNRFHMAHKSYTMLKNKLARNVQIGHLKVECDECVKCQGTGVKAKSKGLTEKVYTACKGCSGSGFIIEENTNEQGTIELRGAGSTGGKGRHKKR